jgi:hypothetical protein
MPPAFARGVIPHDAAAMGVPAIPNDAELAGGEMAAEIFAKGDAPELAEGQGRGRRL